MNHFETSFTCFSQMDVSFDEIVLEGASGGTDALIRYLQSRRQMLARDSSHISLRDDDPAHYVRAIEVIDDALGLLEQFKQIDLYTALETGRTIALSEYADDALPEAIDAKAHP